MEKELPKDLHTDPDNQEQQADIVETNETEISPTPEEPTISQEELLAPVKAFQNFPFALIGGLMASLLSAVLWAVITVATKYQIGYMAIAVGLIVGMAVRFFGAGIDKRFGVLGAILALLGCLLGNLLSQVGFIGLEYSYPYMEVISMLNFPLIADIMLESFSPMDVLFYGIAIYEGYRFSFRPITQQVIQNQGDSDSFKWRMPIVIASAVLLMVVYFVVRQGYSGISNNRYDNGQIMSEGNKKNGKYDGAWTFYYEDGTVLSQGSFYKDVRDGDWQWYSAEGYLEKTGSYIHGSESGVWMNYYENGLIYDSVAYDKGRRNGAYIARYESGALYQQGYYQDDLQEGLWTTYYEDGQKWSEGGMENGKCVGNWSFYYENGKLNEERQYEADDNYRLMNYWNEDSKQPIKDGNGFLTFFHEDGKTPYISGAYKDGKRTGIWKIFSEDGGLSEEYLYDDPDNPQLLNYWNEDEQIIKDGNGTYTSYWEGESVFETGEIRNGLREGAWTTYYADGNIMNEMEYASGKLNGPYNTYYSSGGLSFSSQFVNGQQDGSCSWYNENGTLSSTATIVNNQKEGIQTMYDLSGIQIREEEYQNGKLINVTISVQ